MVCVTNNHGVTIQLLHGVHVQYVRIWILYDNMYKKQTVFQWFIFQGGNSINYLVTLTGLFYFGDVADVNEIYPYSTNKLAGNQQTAWR